MLSNLQISRTFFNLFSDFNKMYSNGFSFFMQHQKWKKNFCSKLKIETRAFKKFINNWSVCIFSKKKKKKKSWRHHFLRNFLLFLVEQKKKEGKRINWFCHKELGECSNSKLHKSNKSDGKKKRINMRDK